MNRIDLLRRELDFSYDQEDWYLPLQPAIAGLTAAQANWRPPGEAANTIWETVNHLIFYKERLLGRLQGNPINETAADNDATYAGAGSSDDEEGWRATVARMEQIHLGLREALLSATEEDFDLPFPKLPMGQQFFSIIMHDAYHTGQIVQIRKLQGSWPARRVYD